jgi:hypothetical protein
MSRSNPTINNPNPSTRWFEIKADSDKPRIQYYDREKEANVVVKPPFTFILLDELSTMTGFHDQSQSGIYANEVRDTRAEPFVVKAFKGGILASGFYANIKDKAVAAGAKFTTVMYIAFKEGKGKLQLGAMKLNGASLSAWFDFRKDNRKAIYEMAITVPLTKAWTPGKKGKIKWLAPKFELTKISEATNKEALAIDGIIQEYLTGYFKKNKADAAQPAPGEHPQQDAPDNADQPDPPADPDEPPAEDDDVPF